VGKETCGLFIDYRNICWVRIKQNARNLSQNRPSRESKPRPYKYEAGLLTTIPLGLVLKSSIIYIYIYMVNPVSLSPSPASRTDWLTEEKIWIRPPDCGDTSTCCGQCHGPPSVTASHCTTPLQSHLFVIVTHDVMQVRAPVTTCK